MAAALGGQPRHSVTPAASAPALPGGQFIGRLLQHVLPLGFKRIRHYGLLAPAAKTAWLASARKLLAMPAANAQAREDAQAFMRRAAGIEIDSCPHCRQGRWCVIEHRGADVWPLPRPCWPHAETRLDAHARPDSVLGAGLRTQAWALLRRRRHVDTLGCAAVLLHRPLAAFGCD